MSGLRRCPPVDVSSLSLAPRLFRFHGKRRKGLARGQRKSCIGPHAIPRTNCRSDGCRPSQNNRWPRSRRKVSIRLLRNCYR
jgi:hypothetical protein